MTYQIRDDRAVRLEQERGLVPGDLLEDGAFPDGRSALMLVAARLRHIAGTRWGHRKYLRMDYLRDLDTASRVAAEMAS